MGTMHGCLRATARTARGGVYETMEMPEHVML
jgi:hypothetical protein